MLAVCVVPGSGAELADLYLAEDGSTTVAVAVISISSPRLPYAR
jgi:hypothetical protein